MPLLTTGTATAAATTTTTTSTTICVRWHPQFRPTAFWRKL